MTACERRDAEDTAAGARESADTIVTSREMQDTAVVRHDTTISADTVKKPGKRPVESDTVEKP